MYITYCYDHLLEYWDVFRGNTNFLKMRVRYVKLLPNESAWLVPGTLDVY